ncbi:VWA domain-containing protein [Actinokineospora enzanensis]|uniref:VWA domain-containing protein n=1 Tax=Actinokineospora enzanensis TaxID=155975 RepID=UPI00035D4F3B|nr:vWA domain-containing protein [Actinokineospora enzanensis]
MTSVELGVEVHQQRFLSAGEADMHAVLTVSSRGAPAKPAGRAAEVLLVDCSSSMRSPHTKIEAAKRAAAAAIGVLPDGARFAVVRGTETADMVYPRDEALAVASADTRREAQRAVAYLAAYGGTAMGTWLDLARRLLEPQADSVRHAILLTDGRNETESRTALRRTLAACEGRFVCDARGIGDGWEPAELTEIVTALRGNVDSVVEDDRLADDFRGLIETALTKVLPEVRLRIGLMPYSRLRFVKQVRPDKYDLTDRCTPDGEGELVLSLGAWAGEESRDYHVCLDLDPSLPPSRDQDRQLAWVDLEPVGMDRPAVILGRWTLDPVQPTLIHPMVLHYTAEAELAAAVTEGGDALAAGRTADAEAAWGRAVRLATEQGNDEILRRLHRVVRVDKDCVRLRQDAGRSEVLNLLISHVSRIAHPPNRRGPDTDGPLVACPHCAKPTRADKEFCVSCGKPVRTGET